MGVGEGECGVQSGHQETQMAMTLSGHAETDSPEQSV